jgi:hypothetical protein
MWTDRERVLVALASVLIAMSGVAHAQYEPSSQYLAQGCASRPLKLPSLWYTVDRAGQSCTTDVVQSTTPIALTPPIESRAANDFDDACESCADSPRWGTIFFSDLNAWHGVSDGAAANYGNTFGFNFATRLGRISDWTGLAFQIGGSYGLYDLTGGVGFNDRAAQQQTFFTTGFSKKINDASNWSYGLVHDWMINRNFGELGGNPTLGQWRGQLSYGVNAWNEFGAWGTLHDLGMTRIVFGNVGVPFRAINQLNFFWHHKFEAGADSWLWMGIPQHSRLGQPGSLGDLLVGGNLSVPLSDFVALYAMAQYMHPSAAPSVVAAIEQGWFVGFGLAYYVGGYARTRTVGGNCWLPLLPVANNGSFLVDSGTLPPI